MTFAVAPHWRRKHVGSFLIEVRLQFSSTYLNLMQTNSRLPVLTLWHQKLLKQLRACDISQVSLHVLFSNDAALRLYAKYGFDILCRIQNYYSLGNQTQDAFWMRKDLTKLDRPNDISLVASPIRNGPWPLGLSFEMFILVIFAVFVLLTTVGWSQFALRRLNYS